MVNNDTNGLKIKAFIFVMDYKYLLVLNDSLNQVHLECCKLVQHCIYNLHQEHMDFLSFL